MHSPITETNTRKKECCDAIKCCCEKHKYEKNIVVILIDDKLVLDKLPDILDENQKKNKVKNIVYAMSRKDKTIINNGTLRYPKWQKSN